MEDKKKRFSPHREGEHKEGNGQRISVRPGNFTPPAEQSAQRAQQSKRREQGRPAPENARRDGQKNGDNRRHGDKNSPNNASNNNANNGTNNSGAQGGNGGRRRNRRNRNRNRQHDEKHTQQHVAHPVAAPAAAPAAKESAPVAKREDRRRDDRRAHKQQNAARVPSDSVSAMLRRELDEEFSTPAFSSFAPKKPEKEQTAVDTDEFAVDIATAAYLLDDIPCGFPAPDGKAVEVVGVRFRRAGKVYFFAPNGFSCRIGESVLVDTARGEELGEIVMLNRKIAEKNVVQPLRAVLRRATKEDLAHEEENRRKEREALKTCAAKIAEHKLDMKLIDAQYTFDNSKLLFYFTSEGRVDFRDLVRDLAGIFRTRIELRQIGIRDESRLIGGLGMCGRPFCCTTFLSDFGQVSIKMAKEQGLSINASKISGCCGRLMCCLRYEHETYAAETRLTPKKDALVETPDGTGVVIEATPLAGTVKVRLDSAPEEAPRTYHRDTVTVLSRDKRAQAPAADAAEENSDESGDESK